MHLAETRRPAGRQLQQESLSQHFHAHHEGVKICDYQSDCDHALTSAAATAAMTNKKSLLEQQVLRSSRFAFNG